MELRPRLGSKMALVTVLVLSVSILIGITGARVDAQPSKPRLCKGPNLAKCEPSPSPSPNPPISPSPANSPTPEPSPATSVTPEPSPASYISSSDPPPADGYFALSPVGTWSSLPAGAECSAKVRYSTWEPRPWNDKRNHAMPDPTAVHDSLAARPRGSGYDARWDSWLLPRVDGQFTGTTDEIFQWAACKWGLPDELLRGIAYRESQWYQYVTYPSGRCLPDYGCTDLFSSASAASMTYCNGLATSGYVYQVDFGPGICPKTFGIVSVMSWEDPAWGHVPTFAGNQNGTFPFNRDSSAFAVDYLGSLIRGCYEGWIHWLGPSGDLFGCVGFWYAGDWHSAAGDGYAQRVRDAMATDPWLSAGFPTQQPPCGSAYGCPGPDKL